MKPETSLARQVKYALAIMLALLLIIMGLNIGGWRNRIISSLIGVYNPPSVVAPPPGFVPHVPPGFKVSVFAQGFVQPRWLATAPNGDIFVSDSAAGKIIVLPGPSGQGQAATRFTFAEKLHQPFGIAFHDDYVDIGDTDEVIRFRYDPKTSRALGVREHILDLPGGGYHQHWTRTLAFSPDGTKLFISVGSESNVGIEPDPRRAAIIEADPNGGNSHIYAAGLRNAVGLAFNPDSGQLWAAVNERDLLGDNQPADYFTHVLEGGFYGWPYSFLGAHVDSRVPPRPDLVAKAIVPDLLLGAHVAPLEFTFYEARQFPPVYLHGAFIAEHGSWNRRARSGYQVVFVPFEDGKPSGDAKPFFTGFVPDPNAREVYGRMVGVTVAADGSLLVSDDGGDVIWRVEYIGG